MVNRIDVRISHIDRATREAMVATVTAAAPALRNLMPHGYKRRFVPAGSDGKMLRVKDLSMAGASSVAASWGGWDKTVFGGDHCELCIC